MKQIKLLMNLYELCEEMTQENLQEEIKKKWFKVIDFFENRFGKKPDLNAILFLIGVRELGQLPDKNFTKEEKTHLMHIANCKLLSYSGYYKQIGFNQKGWPVWESAATIPNLNIFEQENLLRQHIIEYFEQEEIINFYEN
jgi:hypothetical protein